MNLESSYQKIILEFAFRFLDQEHFLNLKKCSLIKYLLNAFIDKRVKNTRAVPVYS